MAYCEISDVTRLIGDASVEDITWAMDLATRLVDKYVGHTFNEPAEGTRTLYNVQNAAVHLPGVPFSDVTAVTVDGTELDSTSYTTKSWGVELVFPDSPGIFSSSGRTVTISASFGYDEVPSDVKYATALWASALIQRNRNRVVQSTDSEGNAILPEYAIDSSVVVEDLPTERLAKTLLDPYRSPVVA